MRKHLFNDLNKLARILGSTTPHVYPFFEFEGVRVIGFSTAGDLTPSETAAAAEALEDDFDPVLLPSGLYAYRFDPTGDHHLAGADHADFSFGNGTVDGAFSVGAWVNPFDIDTQRAIVSKYDASGTDREWAFRLSATGQSQLELYDESGTASEIGVSTRTLNLHEMRLLVVTYDGTETAPVVTHYIDSKADVTTDTTETTTYVAMEAGATPLLIGATGTSASPTEEFDGQIALPFIVGKELTATEVGAIYELTRPMVMGSLKE